MEAEKKARKKKEERIPEAQAMYDALHLFHKYPVTDFWRDVVKKAEAFKRAKTGDENATL